MNKDISRKHKTLRLAVPKHFGIVNQTNPCEQVLKPAFPVLYFTALSAVIIHTKFMVMNQILPRTCIYIDTKLDLKPVLICVNSIYVSRSVAPGQAK